MRKALFFLVMLMFVFAGSALAEQDIQVKVNGEVIEFPDQQPVINSDNRTLVPVRFISEALGAGVEWDGTIKTVFITKEDNDIQITIGDRIAVKNGEVLKLDTEATVINERTMVPLRFVSEALGAKVEWDGATKTVFITTGEQEEVVKDEQKEEKVEEKESSVIDPYNLVQDPNLPEGILTEEQHWALADLVVNTLTVENRVLKGHLPKLPEGFYYSLRYTAIDNLGNRHQHLMFEKEGDSFEIDMSNEQLLVLAIAVYNAKTDTFRGGTTVRFTFDKKPQVEYHGEGKIQKVRELDLEN